MDDQVELTWFTPPPLIPIQVPTRGRCKATSLITTDALPLSQTVTIGRGARFFVPSLIISGLLINYQCIFKTIYHGRSAEEFTVVNIIKQRKLQLFGQICHMPDNRLIKTIMLDMVDGDRHRGKPPRRWVDDIVDWCGRPLPEVERLTVDREEWRIVVTGLNGSQGP